MMNKNTQNTLNKLAKQYNIESKLLEEYANKGCKICYKSNLKNYLSNDSKKNTSVEETERFLEVVIATGMANTLHKVVNESPFTKIKFPKP